VSDVLERRQTVVSLVTGASDFVGSHLVAELLAEEGGSVRALVRRSESGAELHGADVRIGDVRDSSIVQDAVQDVDVVYHCATAWGPASSPRLASRGRAYHITDGLSTPFGEFIDCLAGLLGCPPPQKELPFAAPYLGCLLFEGLSALRLYRGRAPISRTSLNYLGYSRVIDIARARRELGYEPRISYRDGLPLAEKGIEAQV
jgi:nucleoside-diphosphate-sugar epimerase